MCVLIYMLIYKIGVNCILSLIISFNYIYIQHKNTPLTIHTFIIYVIIWYNIHNSQCYSHVCIKLITSNKDTHSLYSESPTRPILILINSNYTYAHMGISLCIVVFYHHLHYFMFIYLFIIDNNNMLIIIHIYY